MLKKTAIYLRLLGFDTSYNDSNIFDLKLEQASSEKRIFLTRDTRIKRIKRVFEYYFVNSNYPEMQIYEILNHFEITADSFRPFSRCLRCNTELEKIDKDLVKERVPDYVFKTQESFSYCKGCDSIYWKATHYERMKSLIEVLKDNLVKKQDNLI